MTTKIAKTTKTVDDNAGTGAAVGDAPVAAARASTGGRQGRGGSTSSKPRQRPAVADGEAKPEWKARSDTKQAKLIAMLKAKDGATVEEIAAAFDWQAHTVRGALYGALRKKLGLDVTSEKVEGKGRVYRIGS